MVLAGTKKKGTGLQEQNGEDTFTPETLPEAEVGANILISLSLPPLPSVSHQGPNLAGS